MGGTTTGKAANCTRQKPKEQLQYVRNVKTILCEAFVKSKLSIPDLQQRLEVCYRININRSTLEKLFNPDDRNIDYACLVTVCTYYGIDMNKLLSPPVQRNEVQPFTTIGAAVGYERSPVEGSTPISDTDKVLKHPFLESIKNGNKKFPVLKDSGYIGKYIGYILPPTGSNQDKEDIVRFDLTLDKDSDDVMHATVVRETSNKESLLYKGVPLYVKAYKIVIMFLTDENEKGEFYFLSFGFEQYRTRQGLVFRKGLSVTGEAFGRSSLVAQNFLIFEHELNQDDKKYLRGLLKAPTKNICIAEDDVTRLVGVYPEVKKFIDAMGDEMSRRKKGMYVLNEDNIISLGIPGITKEEILKALLLLKAESFIGEKFYYKAQGTYSGFAKKYLMRHRTSEPKTK